MEKSMLKEENKIFKNLYNEYGWKINDALKRAIAYSRAGADCVMIHSKDKNPNSIFRFAKLFKKN